MQNGKCPNLQFRYTGVHSTANVVCSILASQCAQNGTGGRSAEDEKLAEHAVVVILNTCRSMLEKNTWEVAETNVCPSQDATHFKMCSSISTWDTFTRNL